MSVPYASAKAASAQGEIKKILRRFGCSKIGFMDDHENYTTTLYFVHRGRQVQMEASGKGWASMFLREEPWNKRRHLNQHDYEQAALNQGVRATSSILRDWVKGQITAIECGVLQFEHVFAPYMVSENGVRIVDVINKHLALPSPTKQEDE